MPDTIQLANGRTRVMIAPDAGGRIAQISIRLADRWLPLLLDSAAARRNPMGWGCFPMLPWPNRLAGASFRFRGRRYRLPANDPPNALHGLAFARPWEVVERDGSSCTLRIEQSEVAPFSFRGTHRIEVEDAGVTLRLTLEALGRRAFPAGVGWHPWFRRRLGENADVAVEVPAARRYELAEQIPTGRLLPVEGAYDLRGCPELEDRRLDDCFRLGRGPMRMRWGDVELEMASSANVRHAVVYTPARAVCMEPQTCAIDAFNLEARGIAAGVQVVGPGHPLTAWTRWSWRILQ
jgi:aldose 1-epimerase